ncbi:MAG: CHAT domain-containing protein [Bacteroidota bacterium]|nr:CHAT domain-containing protein [Bacteroidota bacterium]
MRHTSIIFIVFLLFSVSAFSQTDNEIYKKAISLFNEANRAASNRNFSVAEDSYKEAALLFDKAGYQGNAIQCKMSEAMIYIQENKFGEAELILMETRSKAKKDFGTENNFLVRINYFLGQLKFSTGEADTALTHYERALALQQKFPSPDPFLEAKIYSGLGNSYLALGKFSKSLEYHKKDLNYRINKGGNKGSELVIVYTNLGVAARSMGDANTALNYVEKALPYAKEASQASPLDLAGLYSLKGSIYFDLGQYNLALDFMKKALAMREKYTGGINKGVANEYNNLGQVFNGFNDYDKAIVAYRKAYEIQKQILGKSHPDIALTCSNLASILRKQGKRESALKYYEEAISITKAAYGEFHPDLAPYYHNVALLYKDNKNYKREMSYYLKAKDILENTAGVSEQSLILVYINIAELQRRQGEYYGSLQNYQKALDINVSDFSPASGEFYKNPKLKNYKDLNHMLYAVKGKAMSLTALFMRDSVYEYARYSYDSYMLCDSIISLSRKKVQTKQDKLIFGNKSKEVYRDGLLSAATIAYLQDKEKQKQEYFKQAFYFSEKNKAAILSDAVKAAEVKEFSGIPDSIMAQEKLYKGQISDLENLILRKFNDRQTNELENKLFVVNKKLRDLNTYIENKYPKYYHAKYEQEGTGVSSIQKALKSGQAVRSYFMSAGEIIIFTLTKDNISVSSVVMPSDFDYKIKQLIGYMTSGLKSEFPLYLESSFELYKLLFSKSIDEEIDELIIIPDGILGVIPFEALITEKYSGDILDFGNYPYLIKQYKINYFYSAALFLRSIDGEHSTGKIDSWLGIAPVFSNLKSREFSGFKASELPGTLTEVDDIYKSIENAGKFGKKYIKNAITEKKFKAIDFSVFDVIHIATHGLVNTEHPELSGLLLYPEPGGEEDNILYSGEIYNLELKADLVVLSACETGLGKISKSEGIIGLTRSFLYAGTNNVIVSVWKVEDQSTAELMKFFYKSAIGGKNWSEALHDAKLSLLNRGGKYAHPYFWSPFILIGR